MTTERTVIVVRTNPPGDDEIEWNDWYANVHIAARLEIPGFFLIFIAFRYENSASCNLPRSFNKIPRL